MLLVAHHLQTEANRRIEPSEKDSFGRSSYNRYYCSVFLLVRQLINEIYRKQSKLGHSAYPDYLRATVVKDIARIGKLAQKVNDANLVSQCQRAKSAAHELASLLSTGYAVRVVADYNIDIQVEFSSTDRFKLNGIEITDAHQWPFKAKIFCDSIAELWKQAIE